MTFIGKNFKQIGGFGGRSPLEKILRKNGAFSSKNAKNVTHSDEVHREKLQKKVTILHILSSKLVVPTAKFANNVINFRKRLANLQIINLQERNECFYCSLAIAMWITRKFEDNVAVPNPRSILFFLPTCFCADQFSFWQFETCSPKFHRSFFSKNACFEHQFFALFSKSSDENHR